MGISHDISRFFVVLYGEVTVSRIRLFLTDDDNAEHGPLDCLIATNNCYKNGLHMLCIFHGIVMGFMEKVYPYLPKKKWKKARKEKLNQNWSPIWLVWCHLLEFKSITSLQ